MEEIHNKELVEELRKTEAGSLLLCPEWDNKTETDN
jgi:hypothetical protein